MGMLSSKQQRLAAGDFPPPPTPTRRKGVDKSQPGDAPLQPIPEDAPLLSTTQEINCMDSDSESMDHEDTLLSEESDSEDMREFDAEAEERFNQRLDIWFAEYAPKLFELNQSKWLIKKAKADAKAGSSKSASRQPPPAKKRKTS